jgi:glutathione S-transferase
MKLFHTPTSPFVRKVLIAAHELGLAEGIETTFLRPSPLATDATLSRENPLSKIPVLVLDDGTSLFDSCVICEYLDTLHAREKLVPTAGKERWRVLRTQALADGILEAGIQIFYERAHRPEELQWEAWQDGQAAKARQGLDYLDEHVAELRGAVDLGQIAVASAIGWLEFRKVLPSVRDGRDALFAWYDAFRERPSMKATEPRA